jgi:predicted RNA-binding protein with EMAP domain
MKSKKSNSELLAEKCAKEFKRFCARLPWGSRKQIIDMACEITARDEILTVIRDTDFDDKIVAILLSLENTLDYLYAKYLEIDDLSVADAITDMIEDIT